MRVITVWMMNDYEYIIFILTNLQAVRLRCS